MSPSQDRAGDVDASSVFADFDRRCVGGRCGCVLVERVDIIERVIASVGDDDLNGVERL
jgi:hypothetical protein